jgi:hypothetical protein
VLVVTLALDGGVERQSEIASMVDNIGLPDSSINLTYGYSGTIGSMDAYILFSLQIKLHVRGPTGMRVEDTAVIGHVVASVD